MGNIGEDPLAREREFRQSIERAAAAKRRRSGLCADAWGGSAAL
ncbi:MAG: hypothetical protein ABI596_16910 [Pyrinomonadaceae bacterium]